MWELPSGERDRGGEIPIQNFDEGGGDSGVLVALSGTVRWRGALQEAAEGVGRGGASDAWIWEPGSGEEEDVV